LNKKIEQKNFNEKKWMKSFNENFGKFEEYY
jgi:hypothetical protein